MRSGLCDKVVVKCVGKYRVAPGEVLLFGSNKVLTEGSELDLELPDVNCVITELSPNSPCVGHSRMDVVVQSSVEYEVREVGNVVVIRVGEDALVYDKVVYHELYKLIVEPMRGEGEGMLANGFLLTGLPGVGKTVLVRLLADMAGVYTREIDAAAILSKYVGVAEKRMKEVFEDVKEHEPALLIMHDFDALLGGSRGIADSGEDWRVFQNLLNIFNNEFDSVIGRKIAVIGTTNKYHSALDRAIGRRLVPYFIPPPSMEAVKVWLSESPPVVKRARKALCGGKPDCTVVEDFVVREVQRGATWGHIVDALRRAVATGRLRSTFFEDMVHYMLLAPTRVVKEPPGGVVDLGGLDLESPIKGVPTIAGAQSQLASMRHAPLARLLTYVVAQSVGKHVVYLKDFTYVNDAIAITEQMHGLLLVPGNVPDTVVNTLVSANVPVLFEHLPPQQIAVPIPVIKDLSKANPWLFHAIADFYGVQCMDNVNIPMPRTADEFINYAYTVWALRLNCRDAMLLMR